MERSHIKSEPCGRAGTPRPPIALLAAVLTFAAATGACAPAATGPGTPGPAPAEAAGAADRGAPDEAAAPGAADTAAATPDAAAPFDSAVALESRLVELARRARGPEPELPPIKPFGISWSPMPKEGEAFSVTVYERPTGRKPVAIEGEFAGHAVRFARFGPRDRWLGVGVVPIGWSDPDILTLHMRFEDGAAYEQTVRIAVERTDFPTTQLSVDPRYSSPPPEVLERIRRESEMVREILNTVTPVWQLDGSFEPPRPVVVTSPFGQARMFNGELRSRHTGLDLRARTGQEVRAAGRGRVAFAGPLYFAGNTVYLDHGLGVYTGYSHLSKIDVQPGQEVEKGQLVGEAGATGRVTAAHLHWYLSVDGEAADAGSLLDMRLPD